MEMWRTTLSVFCQKLLVAALNNLQITQERWTSVSCFPWWHLDPGQHPSSHTWYRKSTKCTFFFFAGRDLSYGLPSSLYRTLESSVFHGHCWVPFHRERYQSPASTSEWKPGHQKLLLVLAFSAARDNGKKSSQFACSYWCYPKKCQEQSLNTCKLLQVAALLCCASPGDWMHKSDPSALSPKLDSLFLYTFSSILF